MKLKTIGLMLAAGLIFPLAQSQAAKVPNVNVTADFEVLNLNWDKLSADDFDNADGYAIQWSDRQTDVQITKSATLYQENNVDDISLRRNSFSNNTYYYARVYTYKVDANNKKVLGNGSDMYKFKIDSNNNVESENISVTDPVVSTETGEAQDTSDFEFGVLRHYPYDTFVDFFWSSPTKMTSSDYDGYIIKLSKNSDLSDPVIEAESPREDQSLRITGLEADTTYYAQGFFYKDQGGDNVTFGDGPQRTVKTIVAIPRDSSTRQSRNIIRVENRAIRKVAIDGSASSSSSSSSSSTSTSSSSSNSSSSSSSSSSSTSSSRSSSSTSVNSASQAEVREKVDDLKRQISDLQRELRRWEARLDGGSSSSSSSSTTTRSSSSTNRSTSSSGLSVRERLRLILEAKRNQ